MLWVYFLYSTHNRAQKAHYGNSILINTLFPNTIVTFTQVTHEHNVENHIVLQVLQAKEHCTTYTSSYSQKAIYFNTFATSLGDFLHISNKKEQVCIATTCILIFLLPFIMNEDLIIFHPSVPCLFHTYVPCFQQHCMTQ